MIAALDDQPNPYATFAALWGTCQDCAREHCWTVQGDLCRDCYRRTTGHIVYGLSPDKGPKPPERPARYVAANGQIYPVEAE